MPTVSLTCISSHQQRVATYLRSMMLSAIGPCKDVVEPLIYPTSSIPAKDVDPVLILNQCPTAAGVIFFDCTGAYPCEASNISTYTDTPKGKAPAAQWISGVA